MTSLRQTCKLFGRARQRGQAMVEFAIIALLLILLIAGGVELGIAAFNSNRTAEGAKAATNEWIENLGDGTIYQQLGSNPADTFFTPISNRGLGNHYDLSTFARPACNTDGSYDDGLPNETDVFLYNPLPIDITNCDGNDSLETSRSRVSVLLTGHSNQTMEDNPGNPLLHDGLPAIHQAIYSQYEKVCVDITQNNYLDCGNFSASNPDHRILLKLPGVLADGEATDIGPANSEAMSRLAKIQHDTVSDTFILDEADPDNNIALYPTFHIQCAPATESDFGDSRAPEETCDTADAPLGICWFEDDSNIVYPLGCNVRVLSRYRHTFETFIGMTMAEADEPEMTPVASGLGGLFEYDGGSPGTLGSGLQRGNAPKPYRDFLGCYHTSAVGAAVSGQYLTSFNTISCN